MKLTGKMRKWEWEKAFSKATSKCLKIDKKVSYYNFS